MGAPTPLVLLPLWCSYPLGCSYPLVLLRWVLLPLGCSYPIGCSYPLRFVFVLVDVSDGARRVPGRGAHAEQARPLGGRQKAREHTNACQVRGGVEADAYLQNLTEPP